MAVAIALGQAFLARGAWSFVDLFGGMLTSLKNMSMAPLKVHMVLISQHQEFNIDEQGINTAIDLLYQDEIPEWVCQSYWPAKSREGVARASVSASFFPQVFPMPVPLTVSLHKVILQHRYRRANDPLNHSVLRNLCRKLTGWHTLSTYKFRVVPEWQRSTMSESDRMFGNCLILMQLQDFYDNFKTASNLNNEKLNWVTNSVAYYGIEGFFDMETPSPQSRAVLSLMRRLIEAYSIRSEDDLRGVESDLSDLPTKTFVELLVYTMVPLDRYGRQLRHAVNALGNENHDLDMEYLANILYKVIGSNVPFCGAAGMLCRRVDMGKFSQEVDILGSCCRAYMLLVTRAASFFDRGTSQYESYKRLMRGIYDVDVEKEDFQVNQLLKSKDLEIFGKIDCTREMVQKHGKAYGVEAFMEE
ncbi:hypothetical protein ACHAPT_009385 [Fusarium lateritium]